MGNQDPFKPLTFSPVPQRWDKLLLGPVELVRRLPEPPRGLQGHAPVGKGQALWAPREAPLLWALHMDPHLNSLHSGTLESFPPLMSGV